jgi:hypothetical protein
VWVCVWVLVVGNHRLGLHHFIEGDEAVPLGRVHSVDNLAVHGKGLLHVMVGLAFVQPMHKHLARGNTLTLQPESRKH